jgi:hypothetical protein
LSLALALGCSKKSDGGGDSDTDVAADDEATDDDQVNTGVDDEADDDADDDDDGAAALYEPSTTPDSIAPMIPGALALGLPEGNELRLTDDEEMPVAPDDGAKDDDYGDYDVEMASDGGDGKAEADAEKSEGLSFATDRFSTLSYTVVDMSLSMYVIDAIATAELEKCAKALPCPAEPATVKGKITEKMVNKAIVNGGEGFDMGEAYKARIGELLTFKSFQVREQPASDDGLEYDMVCIDMELDEEKPLAEATDAEGLKLARTRVSRGLSLEGEEGDYSYTVSRTASYCWDADKKHVYTYNNSTSSFTYPGEDGAPKTDTSSFDQTFAYAIDEEEGNDLIFSNSGTSGTFEFSDELGVHVDPAKSELHGASIYLSNSSSGADYGKSSMEIFGYADDNGLYLSSSYSWPETSVTSGTINVGDSALAMNGYILTPPTDLGDAPAAEDIWSLAQGYLYLPVTLEADKTLTIGDFDGTNGEYYSVSWNGLGAAVPSSLEIWAETWSEDKGEYAIAKSSATLDDLVIEQVNRSFYYYEEYTVKDGALDLVYFCSTDVEGGECLYSDGEMGDYGKYYDDSDGYVPPPSLQVTMSENAPELLARETTVLMRASDNDFNGVDPYGTDTTWYEFHVGNVYFWGDWEQAQGSDTVADYQVELWDEGAIGDLVVYRIVAGETEGAYVFEKVEDIEFTGAYVDPVPPTPVEPQEAPKPE